MILRLKKKLITIRNNICNNYPITVFPRLTTHSRLSTPLQSIIFVIIAPVLLHTAIPSSLKQEISKHHKLKSGFNVFPSSTFSQAKHLKKIETLQKRALRFLYDDGNSPSEEAFKKSGKLSMEVNRLRYLL